MKTFVRSSVTHMVEVNDIEYTVHQYEDENTCAPITTITAPDGAEVVYPDQLWQDIMDEFNS